MSAAVKAERRAPLLASVEKCYRVGQVKRNLSGLPYWKRVVFWGFYMPVARFCARLDLPTLVGKDAAGWCWEEDQGTFTSLDGALSAIRGRRWWFWKENPVNALMPEKTGRYLDSGFPAIDPKVQHRASQILRCPYNGSLCNPDETLALNKIVAAAEEANRAHRKLSRLVNS